jgi:CBS-domain-containing membrane protein
VPEFSSGQELVQYLAQLEGQEYAVVDAAGNVTGLLRQATVLKAITGKEPRRGRGVPGRAGRQPGSQPERRNR